MTLFLAVVVALWVTLSLVVLSRLTSWCDPWLSPPCCFSCPCFLGAGFSCRHSGGENFLPRSQGTGIFCRISLILGTCFGPLNWKAPLQMARSSPACPQACCLLRGGRPPGQLSLWALRLLGWVRLSRAGLPETVWAHATSWHVPSSPRSPPLPCSWSRWAAPPPLSCPAETHLGLSMALWDLEGHKVGEGRPSWGGGVARPLSAPRTH